MREEVGGVVRREYHPPPPFIFPRLQMRVEDFRSAGGKLLLGDFLVDSRAYTCLISDAFVQIISPMHPLPSLASANQRIFTSCEESDSRMVFASNARGI